MKRRHILTAGAAIATGASVAGVLGKSRQKPGPSKTNRAGNNGLSVPAISKNRRQFRLATSWPKDFPGLGVMPNRFARAVHELSEGEIDIKVYAAGELVGAAECFDATSTGAADMYHSAEYYWLSLIHI